MKMIFVNRADCCGYGNSVWVVATNGKTDDLFAIFRTFRFYDYEGIGNVYIKEHMGDEWISIPDFLESKNLFEAARILWEYEAEADWQSNGGLLEDEFSPESKRIHEMELTEDQCAFIGYENNGVISYYDF